MKQVEFISKLKESLFEERPDIGLSTELNDIEGWDSLGRLSIVVLLHDEFSVTVDAKILIKCITIQDIVELVKDKLEN